MALWWRLLFSLLAAWSQGAMAEGLTGTVHNKPAGLRFEVPLGWQAQLSEQGYVMGSAAVPGVVLILPHGYTSIAQLKQASAVPLDDGAGTRLSFSTVREALDGRALTGTVQGEMQGQPVSGDIVALVNERGPGVMVMALVEQAQYDHRYPRLAMTVARSIRFTAPQVGDQIAQWQSALRNARLAYLSSYHSSGPSYGGYSTGGGYSAREEIHLCGDGHFTYSNDSSLSVDTGGAFASGQGSDAGQGRWEVKSDIHGRPVMRLVFNDGSTSEYVLTLENGKTYLNGTRYFRTFAGDGENMGPVCP